MQIGFILRKIFNKFEVYKLRKNAVHDNLFLINKSPKPVGSILLYFPDYQMMHFGDHLFFEPLARILKQYDFNIFVEPIKDMEFYFKKLGFIIASENTISNVDLIITKVEFISSVKSINKQVLFINTASSKINTPLCDDIVVKVLSFLGIRSCEVLDTMPSKINFESNQIIEKLNLDKNEKYILFNNYIDASGSFRKRKKHQELIINFVKKLKKDTGFMVIHTGTIKDKNSDSMKYDFVDIDCRGDTSPEGLFCLSSLDNVVYNVSFDAFQMHIFFINCKKSFVMFRGRFFKKNENFIKNYVNPPFRYSGQVSNLIEYI